MEGSLSEKSRNESAADRYDNVQFNTNADKGNAALNGRQEVDPALDKRLNRTFDLHIIPILFGLWLLAFIDR